MQNSEMLGGQASYAVLGNGTMNFPYLEGILSFSKAVELAKQYPQVFSDGSSTHILRSTQGAVRSKFENTSADEQSLRYSHRWKVFKDGSTEHIDVHFKQPDSPLLMGLPDDTHRGPCLDGRAHRQLVSLIKMAERLGATNSALKLEEALTEGAVTAQDMS